MTFRFWLNIITVVLISLVVFLGRNQIMQAWGLFENVNIWILLCMIPVQIAIYFASGEIGLSYLRAKGDLMNMPRLQMARMVVEINFVNGIAIVPMLAGSSYFSWLLRHHGVSVGRSTMSQIVRSVMGLLAFMVMLLVAIILLSLDYSIGKSVIVFMSVLMGVCVLGIAYLIYVISNKARCLKISKWLVAIVNKIGRILRIGKDKCLLEAKKADVFFVELNRDYLEIIDEKKIIVAPFLWSVVVMLLNTLLVLVAFWALGFWVNPAAMFIAFGLASIGSTLAVTPGGAGVYETVMVTFLASAGLTAGVAIAGTLLARVILLAITVGFGYIFYQLTINKYGKINDKSNI